MQPIIVIYHAGCPDGFASAIAARLHFLRQNRQDIEYFAAQHGKPPPDCRHKEVYILDFSFPRATMIELSQQAKQITVIDHHISAEKDLEGIEQELNNVRVIFNMQHSGAILSWNFFQEGEPPLLFKIIEDRDLWKFDYTRTNDVMSGLTTHPMDFELWQNWIDDESQLDNIEEQGKILNLERNNQIEKYRRRVRYIEMAGYSVPIVNAPGSIASDLLQILADGYPFAASYEDREDRRVWQLRSAGHKQIDVSIVAQQFGGGGHKNASGFSTSLPEIKF